MFDLHYSARSFTLNHHNSPLSEFSSSISLPFLISAHSLTNIPMMAAEPPPLLDDPATTGPTTVVVVKVLPGALVVVVTELLAALVVVDTELPEHTKTRVTC
jgi:hypothetical protein